MSLLVLAVLPHAHAADVLVADRSLDVSFDFSAVTLLCPDDFTPIGGGASTFAQGWFLATRLVTEDLGYTASWRRAVSTPDFGEKSARVEISAVCADADAARCVSEEDDTTAVDATSTKALTVLCPPGSFAIGGGMEVLGDPTGVEVWTDAPIGLFAPIGWRVAARTFHADADE